MSTSTMYDYRTMNWLAAKINTTYAIQVSKYARGRLLDVGCGNKPYLDIYQPLVDEYVGLEHPNTPSKSACVDVYGDATDLPFDEASFDTVVAWQVLEHVREPWTALSEMYRVLRPGGHLILTSPFMWGVHEAPNDYFRFTGYGLRFLAERSGFDVLEIKPLGGYWITAGLRFNYYLHAQAGRWLRPLLSPVYLVIQLASQALNRISFSESDACSFGLIAVKPAFDGQLKHMYTAD